MNKLNPMLKVNFNKILNKFEIVCTCSDVFYVDNLESLNYKSRCPKCSELNARVEMSQEETEQLIDKFTSTISEREI